MMLAFVGDAVHAGDEGVQRNHFLPQLALLLYQLASDQPARRKLYYRHPTARNGLLRKVSKKFERIIHDDLLDAKA